MPLDKPNLLDLKKYGACETKEQGEQRTLVRIDIYKKKPRCCPVFLCCSQWDDPHSAAIVSRVPNKKDQVNTYYISYGFLNANYDSMVKRFSSSIDDSKYAEKISLYGYENEGVQSFEEFTKQSAQQFPSDSLRQFDDYEHNCVHAAEHPIRFFSINKHESTFQKILRFAKKILCGLGGTVGCIEACPTLPGVETPAELYRYAKILSQSDEQKKLRQEAEKYNSEPPPSQRMI